MAYSGLLESVWYGRHPLSTMIAPLGWCYRFSMSLRHLAYKSGILTSHNISVPIIIVGNIVAGGTGKTPLVIWLAKYLKDKGYQPGIVSRGYKSKVKQWPQQVRKDSSPDLVGDEPVLLARHSDCPVSIAPNRYAAAYALIEYKQVNIIICDDGLQHHALGRDIEIAVIDGERRHGNGRCLPAGPLRESVSRLKSVDMIVCNGDANRGEFTMKYVPQPLCAVGDNDKTCIIEQFRDQTVHAVAGIGNPGRFFSYLRSAGLNVIRHEFPDHYNFRRKDIFFDDGLAVIMTEKDAVKCERFATDQCWFLPVSVAMPATFQHRLEVLLNKLKLKY